MCFRRTVLHILASHAVASYARIYVCKKMRVCCSAALYCSLENRFLLEHGANQVKFTHHEMCVLVAGTTPAGKCEETPPPLIPTRSRTRTPFSPLVPRSSSPPPHPFLYSVHHLPFHVRFQYSVECIIPFGIVTCCPWWLSLS